jgi:GT2 family glycosyltransferase
MDLSVILVYYKTREHLVNGLTALRRDLGPLEAEIVVVDNDSRDGIAQVLRDGFADVRLLTNSENLGYSRAVNLGLAATRGEFVLVMNPDCTVQPGALAALIGHLRAHPRTGVAGPKILNPDGTLEYSARSFPDHLTFLFNRYSLLTRLFPNNPFSRRYMLTDWDHASVRDVDWLSGACLMVRRTAIAEVGGMDEAFFMFNEDVDWCRRMHQKGWKVTYVPDAVAIHHIGASKRRVAPRVIYGRHLGMIHYFHKHHPTNPVLTAFADTAILLRAGVMIVANAFKLR